MNNDFHNKIKNNLEEKEVEYTENNDIQEENNIEIDKNK